VYVALENEGMVAAIDTLTNKVIANIPTGQTSQALVYVPRAVSTGSGTENLVPLGEAANIARLVLEGATKETAGARASVAVNSVGLLDLVQIAASGLEPKTRYQVCLADAPRAPFGKVDPLTVLTTNSDGAGIVQSVGPMKSLGPVGSAEVVRRFLIVTEMQDRSRVVLRPKTP
jgi:YVTN family beta-propeller protein